jgi:hypothetical protein
MFYKCKPTEVQSREHNQIPRLANQVQTEDHGYRTAVGEELIPLSNLIPRIFLQDQS